MATKRKSTSAPSVSSENASLIRTLEAGKAIADERAAERKSTAHMPAKAEREKPPANYAVQDVKLRTVSAEDTQSILCFLREYTRGSGAVLDWACSEIPHVVKECVQVFRLEQNRRPEAFAPILDAWRAAHGTPQNRS